MKKSLILKYPTYNQVPQELSKHFIRGYFDGDGCISRYVHNTCITPHIELLETKQMLEQVLLHSGISAKYKHDKRHAEETWSLEWSKQEGIDFINYLYQDCSIYLNRKYKLYQFFKNGSRSVEEFTELLSGKNGECLELES